MALKIPYITFETQLLIYATSLLILFIGDIVYFYIYRSHAKKPAEPDNKQLINTSSPHPKNYQIYFCILLNSLIIIFCLTGFIRLFYTIPAVISTFPKPETDLTSYDKPIEFEFSTPIDFTKLKTNTSPETDGEWIFHRYFKSLPFGRYISYKPTRTYLSSQKVMMYLSNIQKPFSNKYGSEFLLSFTAHPEPQISDSTPKNDSVDIPINSEVIFYLSNQNGIYSKWDVNIHPDIKYSLIKKNNEVIVKFSESLMQGIHYTIDVYQTPVITDISSGIPVKEGLTKLAGTVSFTTIKPPLVTSFKPEGEISRSEPVEIKFDQEMDQKSVESNITIIPATKGSFIWLDNGKIFKFLPIEWPSDTQIKIFLNKGISAKNGGVLDSDIEYTFRTYGAVQIKNTFPSDKTQNISIDDMIKITFNQDVNHKSAESNFSIYPQVNGSFNWDGNTLIFKPKLNFAFNTSYEILIKKNIKSIYGSESLSNFNLWFKTSPETYLIDVPYFGQNELFTCNIAAARMLLSFRGINISEEELKKEIGNSGVRGNGNPHIGYTENYGTYWEPITKVISNYRPYRVFDKWNLTDLLSEVSKGNPVMIWGQNGWSDPHELSWTNPDGTQIYAINGMHSSVVRGYKGPKSNPTEIIINDPWRGISSITTAEFTRRWSYFTAALIVD
jgi:uncharacterized protein YvpB